jgi:hypothetical protein
MFPYLRRTEVLMNICSKAPPGAGCGRELRPPPDDPTYYQPAIESEPGPMVTALAPIGIPAHLMRYVRITDGWTIKGLLIPADTRAQGGPVILTWSELGQCWAHRPHPVRAVHLDPTSLCWIPGITPGSVREQSQLLAQRWSQPHRWHRGQDKP